MPTVWYNRGKMEFRRGRKPGELFFEKKRENAGAIGAGLTEVRCFLRILKNVQECAGTMVWTSRGQGADQ